MKRIGLLSLFLSLFFLVSCVDGGGNGLGSAPGFFILNEGNFSTNNGSIESVLITKDTFTIEQRSAEFGRTTCYATNHNGKYYFVSKQGDRLIECSDMTFDKRVALTDIGGGDGRAFVGISDKLGVISTSKGAHFVELKPTLAIGNALVGTEGVQCGALYWANGYLYVINRAKGLQIFDSKTAYSLVNTVAGVSVGFTRASDGSVWCAGVDFLVKITGATTQTRMLPIDVKIYDSWGAWNAGSLRASKLGNYLLFAKHASAWGGGNHIYRYDIAANSCAVFASSKDADDSFYGASIGVNPYTGNIWATFVGGYNYNDNRLVEFDHKTGEEINRYTYDGYKFPALIIF